jgi:maltooligosyltrehalose trehalohydrolase
VSRVPTSPGAHFIAADPAGTTFAAWSTTATAMAVRLFDGDQPPRTVALDALGDGRFAKHLAGIGPGALYKLVLDGDEVPDPYARFLPSGVHGPAAVVAPASAPALTDPPPPAQWVIYEMHVGTFSPEGTYRGAEARLGHLEELGVTAVELLPLAAFPGERGWGYDGVALYAPYAGYGEPEDLRSFVSACHRRGIAVVLDVVYNHFGPAGNYLSRYAPAYFTAAIETPWGPAPDFAHAPMRGLVLDNARYWLEEFGFDGLRLDATHEVHDPGELHVLREITYLARAMSPPRRIFFEDERIEPSVVSGLGADGVWADDFHHQIHVLLTGERDGYYAAYEPTVEALARAIDQGWTFTGQPFSPWKGKPRGRAPREHGVAPEHLIFTLQNHDQIGNRALGTRLTEDVDHDAYCAASVLLLALPATPLLFMGQEWASSSPFLFFSDHEGELGEAIRKGRREEFKTFTAFADPKIRESIPDPQAKTTFESSKLIWNERHRPPHERVLGVYRTMIHLRRNDPVLGATCRWEDLSATALPGDVLEVVRRRGNATRTILVNFGKHEHVLTGAGPHTVLFASSPLVGGKLPPRSAVVLGKD